MWIRRLATPIFPLREVPVEQHINARTVAALAAEDQRTADARSQARALSEFWNGLPRWMPRKVRSILIVRWQENQSRWIEIDDFDDEDPFD